MSTCVDLDRLEAQLRRQVDVQRADRLGWLRDRHADRGGLGEPAGVVDAQLRDEERLLPWLMGIARRVCLEDGRRRRVLEPVGGAEESEAHGQVGPAPPTPEELLLDRELEGLLGAALATLREERRAALLLRVDHGLAYEEIAAVMGWTLPKVKNEIHRARLQLRAHLAPHVGGGR